MSDEEARAAILVVAKADGCDCEPNIRLHRRGDGEITSLCEHDPWCALVLAPEKNAPAEN